MPFTVQWIGRSVNLICLTVFFFSSGFAQEQPRFTAYSVNEGLPQGSVWDITQDANGFLWVGTSDGLARFDGYNFNVYKHRRGRKGTIQSSVNNFFYVDQEKQLWVASVKGLSLYNAHADNFSNVFTYAAGNYRLETENFIYGEYKGEIWAGFANCGFVKANRKTKKAVKVAAGAVVAGASSWIRGFVENGRIYGSTSNGRGFFIYDIAANTFTQPLIVPQCHAVLNYSKTEVMFADPANLYFYNKHSGAVRTVPLKLTNPPRIISDVMLDEGTLILGSVQGMHWIDPATGRLIRETTNLNYGGQEAYSYIQTFFKDRSGNLWIGTNGDGLRKISFQHKKFRKLQPPDSKNTIVRAILADEDKIYIGGATPTIDVFARGGKFLHRIDIRNFQSQFSQASVYRIRKISEEQLLIYVFNHGANRTFLYNTQTRKPADITQAILAALPRGFIPHNGEYVYTRQEQELIGAVDDFIFSIGLRGAKPSVKLMTRIPGQRITYLHKDDKGNLWVATYDGLYKVTGNTVKRIDIKERLLFKAIEQAANGDIWVGTADGIYVIDQGDKVTRHYTEETGLTNGYIYGILRDRRGRMWFSTNKGIGRYEPNSSKFTSFTKEDGLSSTEFNGGAFYAADNGELFFGGVGGTDHFNPDDIAVNPNTPPVRITGINLFDRPYVTDEAAWTTKELTLPYTDNTISFEFTLPEYTNGRRNIYAYRMDGIDDHWINSGRRRFSRYAALDPGSYIFRVKAANDDGVWGSETIIAVNIIPPIWQRAWMRILIALLATATIIFVVSAIQRRNFRKKMRAFELQQKVQMERERISRDLHDHVGTQLSLIRKNIQGMIETGDSNNKDVELENISQSSQEVINTLRETIWALNKEAISLEEFADKLQAFAIKQLQHNSHTSLQFNSDPGTGNLELNASEAINLFRICQEAITNSLKYANAAKLNINIGTAGAKFHVRIHDDGQGFDPLKTDKLNNYGLTNMKVRAAEIGCELFIISEPGNTTITIEKKIAHMHYFKTTVASVFL